jgi:hypothetical protein
MRGLFVLGLIAAQPSLEAAEALAPGTRLRVTAPTAAWSSKPPDEGGNRLVGTWLPSTPSR